MVSKNMTLRLDADRAAKLMVVARVDGRSQNDTVLAAIDMLAAERRQDPAFRQRLEAVAKADRATLERMAT